MAESPRKRQRLSDEDHERQNDAIEDGNDSRPVPTTPTRRASYLSPTKASLARSHPNVLAKSPKKGSLTEPRGRLLRQELLGSRNEQDNTDNYSIPKTAPRPARTVESEGIASKPLENSDKDGFAEAIAKSFQDAVADRSTSRDRSQPASRSPLHTRQGPAVSTGKRARNEKEESLSVGLFPVPTLVKKSGASVQQTSAATNEPDLPPTPVQLGLGPAPDRPRGLASSSSTGSKSGSGKHRRRVRVGSRTALISSPLKPKHQGRVPLPIISDIGDIENEMADEAPESDVEDVDMRKGDQIQEVVDDGNTDQLSAVISEKETELSRLQSELKKLQRELMQFEKVANDLQNDATSVIPQPVLHLLHPTDDPKPANLQSPGTHPSFVKDPLAYLKLFAPSNLSMIHRTTATTVKRKPHLVHNLDISVTSPWPPDALKLCFEIDVDAERSSIQRVYQLRDALPNPHERLQRWVDDRLSDDLHKFDISSIIWGAGQYFQSCVSRAKTFRAIDNLSGKGATELLLNPQITRSEEMLLYPYIHRSQDKVSIGGEAFPPSAFDGSPSKQILLTYDIELTWTGNARSNVDITLAGITGKAEKNAKELFAKLLASEGVLEAFRAVYDLLKQEENGQEIVPPKKSVGRPRKVLNVS